MTWHPAPTTSAGYSAPSPARSPPTAATSTTRHTSSRDELRIAIVTWIERTYHRRRRQAALGRLTPIEYETIMTPQALAA
jgi:transposase InsO family protein